MNTIIIYMVKAAVYLIAFCLVYLLLLKRDTAHGRNRAFILTSLLVSFALPLITFNIGSSQELRMFNRLLAEVFITPESGKVQQGAAEAARIISYVYLAGFIGAMLKLVLDMAVVAWLILKYREPGNRIIKFHNFSTSGFSAMGYIFINGKLSDEDAGSIIDHERNHLGNNHYIDIIILKIIGALQWFNPAIHLFDKELRAIHEFQADRQCLDSGIPVVRYQSLLLNQVFRGSGLKLTNSFSNPSLVRKRMLMMTRKRSSPFADLKLAIAIPVTLVVFLSVSAKPSLNIPPPPPPPAAETEEVPFIVVEEMPMFPGGDVELLRYISLNTVYPETAKQNNIEGRVIIRFCVTSRGTISQASVLKGVSPELDREALRVVSSLPEFIPGRQGGVAVPVWYMVPITFTLR